ncbi:MAG TPA: hypothetical protein VE862_12510 [Candidatus Acidoferrum sp.]|nr:hypothetical protein [Candidatus Acidoferrum sp.]
MKQEFHATFQSKKTGKYGDKQYYQLFLPFPAHLCRLLDIKKGQVIRLINGNGEIILKKVESKPMNKRPKYDEWLKEIKPYIPTEAPAGKTYRQICIEAGLDMKAAPAEWVHKAKKDIGLISTRDKKTHRILWFRVEQVKQTFQQKLPNYAVLTSP